MKEHIYGITYAKDEAEETHYLLALCKAESHFAAEKVAKEHLTTLPGYILHSVEYAEIPAIGKGVVELLHT